MDGRNNLKIVFFLLQLQARFLITYEAVCPFALDLAFLLDASGSIGINNYKDMKNFINDVIDHFHLSPTDTHVGVVRFSTDAKTEIPFTHQQSVKQIKEKVSRMAYSSGTTRLDLGLSEIHKQLFSSGGGTRPQIPHVLLAITDGASDMGAKITKKESQSLKDDGVVIYALGIGSKVHQAELETLASETSHVFRYKSVRQMLPQNSALEIALALCSVARTSNAILFPVVTQRSLQRHTIASRSTTDDLECAFLCIRHKSCYSFNFVSASKLCQLNYAKRSDFPQDFIQDRGSVYSELKFEQFSQN